MRTIMVFKVDSHKADFNAIVKRSRDVAEKMSGGVQVLDEKKQDRYYHGNWEKFNLGKQLRLPDEKGKTTEYSAKTYYSNWC